MEDELIKQMTYYRAINKLSKIKFAKMLKTSVNTLNKILNGQKVKETTRIYVTDRFIKLKKEGEK